VFPQDAEISNPRTEGKAAPPLRLSQFGRRYILMKTRARVTKDGGASILVIPGQEESEESEDEEESENEEEASESEGSAEESD